MSEVLYTAQVPSGLRGVAGADARRRDRRGSAGRRRRCARASRSAIQEVSEFRGDYTVTIRPQDLVPVATFLRDDPELALQPPGRPDLARPQPATRVRQRQRPTFRDGLPSLLAGAMTSACA